MFHSIPRLFCRIVKSSKIAAWANAHAGGPMQSEVQFCIAQLDAVAPDGLPVHWQGRTFHSGPVIMTADPDTGAGSGILDYTKREATAEFRVLLTFPELAETLEDLGAAAEFCKPMRAVIRSQGPILDDHSFELRGEAELAPHPFVDEQVRGCVLPGT
jgi:hypothetical protein